MLGRGETDLLVGLEKEKERDYSALLRTGEAEKLAVQGCDVGLSFIVPGNHRRCPGTLQQVAVPGHRQHRRNSAEDDRVLRRQLGRSGKEHSRESPNRKSNEYYFFHAIIISDLYVD